MKVLVAWAAAAVVVVLIPLEGWAQQAAPMVQEAEDPRWNKLRLQDVATALQRREADLIAADDQLVKTNKELEETRVKFWWTLPWGRGVVSWLSPEETDR